MGRPRIGALPLALGGAIRAAAAECSGPARAGGDPELREAFTTYGVPLLTRDPTSQGAATRTDSPANRARVAIYAP